MSRRGDHYGYRGVQGRGGLRPVISPAEARRIQARMARINHRAERGGGFRFRRQLGPLAWPALMACGLIPGLAPAAAAIAGLAALGTAVALTRHRSAWVRKQVQGSAAWAAAWLVILSAAGPGWWAAVALTGWAVPYGFWLHKYAWRLADPDAPPDKIEERFEELAERQRWNARLGPPEQIPNGTRYPIACNGAHTQIGQITSANAAVAATFDKAVTEAYAERDPSGIESRGRLTLLTRGTLDQVREWDGLGYDGQGFARLGRFPDGMDFHGRAYKPGKGGGACHYLIAGADGTGKTAAMNLLLAKAARTPGIAPVILDPQMGQALPAWRDHVPYACGTDECLAFLSGLHDAMFGRSDFLGSFEWTDPRTGKLRRGLDHFDSETCGRPLVQVFTDEAPVLLAVKGVPELILDFGKLGRKVGFSLVLAVQVPSVKEMQAGELRSILNGGTVICYRTGDKVSSGMLNLPAEPNLLPQYFPDGSKTEGLGYGASIEARPDVAMRTDYVPDPYEVAEEATITGLDDDAAGHLAAALTAASDMKAQARRAAQDKGALMTVIMQAVVTGVTCDEIARVAGIPLSQVVACADEMAAQGHLRREGVRLTAP
jgi:hypothetical protein